MAETCHILEEMDRTLNFSVLLPEFLQKDEIDLWKKRDIRITFAGESGFPPDVDLAVTQPGTNNLELMHLGIPSIIAIPFAYLDEIPLGGIRHFLCAFPFLGKKIKRAFLERLNKKIHYVSWPNRIARRELQEELRGYFTPRDLAVHIYRRVNDGKWLEERSEASLQLSSLSRKAPSRRIVDMIERLI